MLLVLCPGRAPVAWQCLKTQPHTTLAPHCVRCSTTAWRVHRCGRCMQALTSPIIRVGQIQMWQAQATVNPVQLTVQTACIPYDNSKQHRFGHPYPIMAPTCAPAAPVPPAAMLSLLVVAMACEVVASAALAALLPAAAPGWGCAGRGHRTAMAALQRPPRCAKKLHAMVCSSRSHGVRGAMVFDELESHCNGPALCA